MKILFIITLFEVALGLPHETVDEEDFMEFEFKSYDANGDNKVSAEEVRAFYESSGRQFNSTKFIWDTF